MSEAFDMTARLQESASALLDFVENSATFVKEQAPIVVQEILNWNMAFALVWVGLSFIVGWVLYTCVKVFRNQEIRWADEKTEHGKIYYRDENYKHDPDHFGSWAVAVAGTLILSLIAIANFFTLLKIMVAPRLFLLQELGRMFADKTQ